MTFRDEETRPFITEWRDAKLVKVVDGDTFDFQVDLGFDVHTITRFRLLNVDTWEVRGEEREKGLLAKGRVEELIGREGVEIRIKSFKGGSRGKYGRWLAAVIFRNGGLTEEEEEVWTDLATTLLEEGHATLVGI